MSLSNISWATEIIGIIIVSVVLFRYYRSEKKRPSKSKR